MKRLFAVLLCCILLISTCFAEMTFIGDMEVIKCNSWVNFRENPTTKAKRLAKVPLGSVVTNCQKYDEEWIYAEYNGISGYIHSSFLQVIEEEPASITMMITIGDGAPFCSAIDSKEPVDVIPANTIVRNCSIVDNDRVYVEWGSRCGYINLLHAEVYNEMLRFPRQITLHTNFYGEEFEAPLPDLKVAYSNDFPVKEYDYNVYEYADFMEADDPELPKVTFVLYTDAAINHVHLFSVFLSFWDEKTGDVMYEATLEDIQYQMDPDHPLYVGAVIWGDMTNLAVGFEDAAGEYHFAFIEISGEDGSLMLREF